MSESTKQKEQRLKAKEEGKQILPLGVKLLHTLKGHKQAVMLIAFDQKGETLSSWDLDKSAMLWDVYSGKLLQTRPLQKLAGGNELFGQKTKAVVRQSRDLIKKIANALVNIEHFTSQTYKFHYKLTSFPSTMVFLDIGTQGTIIEFSKPFSPKAIVYSEMLLSNKTMMFISESNFLNKKYWAHEEAISDSFFSLLDEVARLKGIQVMGFVLQGWKLALGSGDGTVKIYDVRNGKLLRTLEGHSKIVDRVAFSPDGRLLASKSKDHTIRLWNCKTWETVAVIPQPINRRSWIADLTFHPTLPLLATAGSNSGSKDCKLVFLWELDYDFLLGQHAGATVTYTSAKVVLVGESNVGKSYLAHRIATGKPPEQGAIQSTHGMKFWPMEPAVPVTSGKARPKPRSLAFDYNKNLFGQAPGSGEKQRRDIVLWDMGGQEEYRLIHQLFLHDTTLALVLLDPTRGTTAFKEVEGWNKALETCLRGRDAVKLLVGAKVDRPSEMIDRQGLKLLRKDCGFVDYCETSAITGRGVEELCKAVGEAIDWDELTKTSRPELFQRIRDEIEARRKRGEVVLSLTELHKAVGYKDPRGRKTAVHAVTEQLAAQGVIARSRMASGKPVLVLQIQEIERYAGSLILAARKNPRGVPALELRAVGQAKFVLPGIANNDRLPRKQEKPVMECTVQLMLEHGICFEHEGLLIFPSLFVPALETADVKLPHSVSLYYDFSGAIDNIYASLVAWLVLAKEFGKLRLWSDRAEFELKDRGLCGLLKRGRPGGFAHVEVYFEKETPQRKQKEFISFVEDHLARNGIEIREHVAIKCACGHEFAEETIRQRIARGDKDVVCPVCETRHNLSEGAATSRARDEKIAQHTWALRTKIEKRREKMTKQVVQVLAKSEKARPATSSIRLLHLSDLHFTKDTPVEARLQALVADIKHGVCLGFEELDYVVISGDFTDRGCAEGFEKAYEFASGLATEFELSAERFILVPGNHDVRDTGDAFEKRTSADGNEVTIQSAKYPERFKAFSDGFYHKFLLRAYPLDTALQGIAIPFWETGIQFLALNSCWEIDQYNRKRKSIHPNAVANALLEANKQEKEAKKRGKISGPLLRIAVWHHAVAGPEMMPNVDFLGHLQNDRVRLALHGDVHEIRRLQNEPWHKDKPLFIAGAGAFGAPLADRPESAPRMYNLLVIDRKSNSARIHTRQQPKPDGPWKPWNEWPRPDEGDGGVPYYDIKW